MKFDGTNWTDVSGDVYYADQISITAGAGDEGARVDTSTCRFTLDNTTANYTPDNPTGAYYPNIGRNTPVRVSALTGTTALFITGTNDGKASTPDAAALDILGDIDVRLEAEIWNWTKAAGQASFGRTELIGKHTTTGNKSWLLATQDGALYFEWSSDGTNTLSAQTAFPLKISSSTGRMAVRATLDVDNGASGRTVTFYRSTSITGDWEQIGTSIVQAGTTSIFNSTSSLAIGDATGFFYETPLGRIFKAEVRNGINGTVVANPDFTIQAEGATSFNDATGKTWTTQNSAEITQRKIRFVGEVSSWTPRVQQKSRRYVDVEAGGVMRRLGATDIVLKSALDRDITQTTGARSNVIAYWPMEDGPDADGFASGLPTGTSTLLTASGIDKASYADYAASGPIPTFTNGVSRGFVPTYSSTGYISVRWFAAVPSTGTAGTRTLMYLTTNGTAASWRVQVDTGGSLIISAYDSNDLSIYNSGAVGFAVNGTQRMMEFTLATSGADINYGLNLAVLETATINNVNYNTASGTVTGVTVGAAQQVHMGSLADLAGTALGQVSVAIQPNSYSNSNGSLVNWKGEPAGERLARMQTETGYVISSAGRSYWAQGGQGETDLLTLLRDIATTETGILCENRDVIGFHYRAPDSLTNQTPTMTIPFTGDILVEPFGPDYDDLKIVNAFTANRKDGGSATLTQTTGRMQIANPPTGVGRYEGSDQFNLFADTQTIDAAGFRLNIGTYAGSRFSRMTVLLQKNAAQTEAACRTYVGDIIKVTGLPSWACPDSTILLKVEGYTETINQFQWQIDYTLSPAGPWEGAVTTLDTATGTTAYDARQWTSVDTDGSTLSAALSSGATSVGILTAIASNPWTSKQGDSPYNLTCAGEVMRIESPSALTIPNSFFDTSAANWSGTNASVSWVATPTAPHPSATGSLLVTPNGVSASGGASSAKSGVGTINVGGQYTTSMWVYSPGGWSDLRPSVDWYDSSGVFVSSSIGVATVVAAAQWTYIEQTFTAPALASQAVMGPRFGGTPTSSNIYYVWGARVCNTKASAVFDQFGRTLTDTWGTTDTVQTWTNTGGVAADYDVLSGYGRHINPATSVGHHSVVTSPSASFDIYCDIAVAALSTGASQFCGVLARYTSIDNLYEARVEFTTTNTILLSVRKRVTAVETQIATFTTQLTNVAAQFVRVRFQGDGSNLKAKIWLPTASLTEPNPWSIETTDSALVAAGSIGVKSVRGAGNTNVNADSRFENFELVNPQSFTATRSFNGVVKAQSSGAAISLTTPAIVGV